MTASACRSYRILGLFARAVLLGVLLGPAPAALAQGTTTFDIRVPRRSGGLLPLSQFAMRFYNRQAFHDYEGVAIDLDEQARLV